MEFSRPEYWSGSSPGDLPNPGIEPRSPSLQADSLPAELPGTNEKVLNVKQMLSQGTWLSAMRQPDWEGNTGENGYMYI